MLPDGFPSPDVAWPPRIPPPSPGHQSRLSGPRRPLPTTHTSAHPRPSPAWWCGRPAEQPLVSCLSLASPFGVRLPHPGPLPSTPPPHHPAPPPSPLRRSDLWALGPPCPVAGPEGCRPGAEAHLRGGGRGRTSRTRWGPKGGKLRFLSQPRYKQRNKWGGAAHTHMEDRTFPLFILCRVRIFPLGTCVFFYLKIPRFSNNMEPIHGIRPSGARV